MSLPPVTAKSSSEKTAKSELSNVPLDLIEAMAEGTFTTVNIRVGDVHRASGQSVAANNVQVVAHLGKIGVGCAQLGLESIVV